VIHVLESKADFHAATQVSLLDLLGDFVVESADIVVIVLIRSKHFLEASFEFLECALHGTLL